MKNENLNLFGKNNLKINVIYYNSIGVLLVKVIITNKEKSNYTANDNPDTTNLNFFNKSEDGKLTIMIKTTTNKLNISSKFQISILFSNSMRVNINDTLITTSIKEKEKEINFKYFVTKELLSKDTFFEKLYELQINNCFVTTHEPSNDQLDFFDFKNNWSNLESIICKNCNNTLIKKINTDFDNKTAINENIKMKLIFNFNYDYFSNLEMLSCHEADIENIIPNLDEKLKYIVNINNVYTQINSCILDKLEEQSLNKGCENKNYNFNSSLYDEILCNTCSIKLGEIEPDVHKMKFYDFYNSLLIFLFKSNVKKEINTSNNIPIPFYRVILGLKQYLHLLIFYSLLENKKKIIFRENKNLSEIIFLIKTNILYFSELQVEEELSNKKNLIDKFHYLIVTEIVESDGKNKTDNSEKVIEELNNISDVKINIIETDKNELLSLIEENKQANKNISEMISNDSNIVSNNFYIIKLE